MGMLASGDLTVSKKNMPNTVNQSRSANEPSSRVDLFAFKISGLLVLLGLGALLVFNLRHPQAQLLQNSPAKVITSKPTGTETLVAIDWDSYDLQGQDFFNNGKYEQAESAFLRALELAGSNDNHKLISLQKLALLQHIEHKTAEEKRTDKRLEALQQAMKSKSTDTQALVKALQLLPAKASPNQMPAIEGLANDILNSCRKMNKQAEYQKALELVDAALPQFKRLLGDKSKVLLNLLSEKAESLLRLESPEAANVAQQALDGLAEICSANDLSLNLASLRRAEAFLGAHDFKNQEAADLTKAVLENFRSTKNADAFPLLSRAHLLLGLSLWNQVCQEQAPDFAYKSQAGIRSAFLDEAEKELKNGLELHNADDDQSSIQQYLLALAQITLIKSNFDAAQKLLIDWAKSADLHSPLLRAQYLTRVGEFSQNGRQPPISIVYPKKAPCLREALQIRQHCLSPESKLILRSLSSLINLDGSWLYREGHSPVLEEHEALLRQVIALLERAGAPNGKIADWAKDTGDQELDDIHAFYMNLAFVLYNKHDLKAATEYWDKAFSGFQESARKGIIPYAGSFPELAKMSLTLKGKSKTAELMQIVCPGGTSYLLAQ